MRIAVLLLSCLIVMGCGETASNPESDNCSGPAVQACLIEYGSGQQSRSCEDGDWSAWEDCQAVGCDAGYYQDGNECAQFCEAEAVRTSACEVPNGSGQTAQVCSAEGRWRAPGPCSLVACDAGYYPDGDQCLQGCEAGATRSLDCEIENGSGQTTQVCTDDGRWAESGSCEIVGCDTGYHPDGNQCTQGCEAREARTVACEMPGGSGLVRQVCSQDGHWIDADACKPICDDGSYLDDSEECIRECEFNDTRVVACEVSNGSGQIEQICEDQASWTDVGTCTAVACDQDYYPEGGQCVQECEPETTSAKACTVDYGTGQIDQVCSGDRHWTDSGTCDVVACHDGFYLENNNCLPKEPTVRYDIEPDANKENLLEFTIDSTDMQPPLNFSVQHIFKAGIEISSPDHISLDASSGLFSWTPTPSQSAGYDFHFLVTDSLSNSMVALVRVTVTTMPICSSSSSACLFLKEEWDAGQAAGNLGDWYDNRDNFHTRLSMSQFPQLDLMTSGYGSTTVTHRGRVVVGNSSTAIVSGESWMSQMRNIMLSSYRTSAVYTQYMSNNHYWYPEHRDHDDKDHYHGKNPFVTSSQGSSGSEMDEVTNFFYTLAAFQPEVKEKLKETGLLMPTLQMIFRRVRVADDAAYLTGAAHPSAFDNYSSGRLAMVEMANTIGMDDIPPMVQLEVIEENYASVEGKTEQWYTTPVSISRIFRGSEYTKRIVVSAANSYDLNDRPLTYHWAVLRGDPEHVVITPQNEDGSQVEILIDYHPETTIAGSERLTNMVEVGAFVHNGVYYSAPGFITDFTLNNEERTYNHSGELTDIQYNENYVHPYLR